MTSIPCRESSIARSEAAQDNHATNLTEEASKQKYGDDANQDLLLDVLESFATKREAKAYLSRFDPDKIVPQNTKPQQTTKNNIGVNLGNLYPPIQVAEQKSMFSHTLANSTLAVHHAGRLHAALVKVRGPQLIDNTTLQGIGRTLFQLVRLGLGCVVIIDPEVAKQNDESIRAEVAVQQANRIVDAIDALGPPGARRLDGAILMSPSSEYQLPFVKIQGNIKVANRNLLLNPLQRGMIPVIAPIGYISDSQKLVPCEADDIVLALTREFAGIKIDPFAEEDAQKVAEHIKNLQKQIALDRIIVLDPLGGIPSTDNHYDSHVFINLEQEYHAIKRNLLNSSGNAIFQGTTISKPSPLVTDFASSSSFGIPSAKFSVDGSGAGSAKYMNHETSSIGQSSSLRSNVHAKNLELLRNALAILPPSSSAFLTTPNAVASLESRPSQGSQGPRVRTRRRRNPLIHNLLTDKPVLSPSLPTKMSSSTASQTVRPVIISSPTTFLKRGMPVGIVPNPLEQPWRPSTPSNPAVNLSDPRIDLPRFFHLIEDSFNRKLDVPKYLARIKDRIAGVVIAGEYEGGALLTWETPPGARTHDTSNVVPYLDKFAVLKRSQGAGGVADIVFNAMVRDCFPKGVCWRSRTDNPVNKWYFERAKGTWKIPSTDWTMFWTTDGVERCDGVFLNYARVCKAIMPNWVDIKR